MASQLQMPPATTTLSKVIFLLKQGFSVTTEAHYPLWSFSDEVRQQQELALTAKEVHAGSKTWFHYKFISLNMATLRLMGLLQGT